MREQLRILVAEDDASVRQMTALRLQQLGHRVEAVEDGRRALALCHGQGRAFDLVVTDVQMPELDGPALIRELRTHPDTRNLPILVISCAQTAEGMRAGADHFLAKPHTKKQLAEAIQHTLTMCATGNTGAEGTPSV